MFNLEITALDGVQSVKLPAGWHEIDYKYYLKHIAPFSDNEEDVVANNVNMICSMIGIKASEVNVMEFATIFGNLLQWIEEVPNVSEFEHKGVRYQIPVLGKAQAGDKPFMSVADWQTANDAMKFLQQSDLNEDSAADVGLVLLCALARGPKEVDDVEFARRLKDWQSVSMDVLLSASFFFLMFMTTYEQDIPSFLTELKRRNQKLQSMSLDGIRYFYELLPQVFLQSLHMRAQS